MLKPTIKEESVNASERILANQSLRTFFDLWSYPNIYRDESKGTEVADLAVYFNNTLIIFSDKGEVKFQIDRDVKLAWTRWYRRAVKQSAVQLYGAESFIRRYPNRIFLDKKCQNPFPFDLSDPHLKIHLIAVVRGIGEHAKKHFDSYKIGSSGTLAYFFSPEDSHCPDEPFLIRRTDKNKSLVHVLDDVGIKRLLEELDTPVDFINYLNAKEDAILSRNLIGAGGEEDILAFYLQEVGDDGFGSLSSIDTEGQSWIIPEHEWSHYYHSEYYINHVKTRQAGAGWKNIIANFSKGIVTANVGEFSDQPLLTHARAIQALASENISSRAYLAECLFSKYDAVPTRARSARVTQSTCNRNRLYVFLFFPLTEIFKDLEDYRRERFACMQLYAWVARLKFKFAKEIIVLGANPQGSKFHSETILAIDASSPLSITERRAAEKIMIDHKIFLNIKNKNHKDNRSSIKLQRKFLKPGRNTRCPCGSGIKYKHCCLYYKR